MTHGDLRDFYLLWLRDELAKLEEEFGPLEGDKLRRIVTVGMARVSELEKDSGAGGDAALQEIVKAMREELERER